MSSILDSLEAAYNEIAALKAECERQHVLIVKLNQEVERQRVWLRNNAEMLDGKQERIDELLAQQGDLCESNNARQDEIDRLRAALKAEVERLKVTRDLDELVVLTRKNSTACGELEDCKAECERLRNLMRDAGDGQDGASAISDEELDALRVALAAAKDEARELRNMIETHIGHDPHPHNRCLAMSLAEYDRRILARTGDEPTYNFFGPPTGAISNDFRNAVLTEAIEILIDCKDDGKGLDEAIMRLHAAKR